LAEYLREGGELGRGEKQSARYIFSKTVRWRKEPVAGGQSVQFCGGEQVQGMAKTKRGRVGAELLAGSLRTWRCGARAQAGHVSGASPGQNRRFGL